MFFNILSCHFIKKCCFCSLKYVIEIFPKTSIFDFLIKNKFFIKYKSTKKYGELNKICLIETNGQL